MIHTSITQNCTVFILRRELTRSAIYGSQSFDSHKWPIVFVDEVKRRNGFRTLFKDNSTDPRQRVPLNIFLNVVQNVPDGKMQMLAALFHVISGMYSLHC